MSEFGWLVTASLVPCEQVLWCVRTAERVSYLAPESRLETKARSGRVGSGRVLFLGTAQSLNSESDNYELNIYHLEYSLVLFYPYTRPVPYSKRQIKIEKKIRYHNGYLHPTWQPIYIVPIVTLNFVSQQYLKKTHIHVYISNNWI